MAPRAAEGVFQCSSGPQHPRREGGGGVKKIGCFVFGTFRFPNYILSILTTSAGVQNFMTEKKPKKFWQAHERFIHYAVMLLSARLCRQKNTIARGCTFGGLKPPPPPQQSTSRHQPPPPPPKWRGTGGVRGSHRGPLKTNKPLCCGRGFALLVASILPRQQGLEGRGRGQRATRLFTCLGSAFPPACTDCSCSHRCLHFIRVPC